MGFCVKLLILHNLSTEANHLIISPIENPQNGPTNPSDWLRARTPRVRWRGADHSLTGPWVEGWGGRWVREWSLVFPISEKRVGLVGQSESTAADHGRIDQMSVFVCVTVETSNVCIPWERGQMVGGELVSILQSFINCWFVVGSFIMCIHTTVYILCIW